MMSVPCLFAVDGVVLINQSTVTAAGGFPYKITQPGSYRLSGNLTVPDANTTAISIRTTGVTLDLNGFSIIGPISCSFNTFVIPPVTSCPAYGTGNGVDDTACPNCTFNGNRVINGTVQGMGSTGIFLHGGIVKDVIVQQNALNGILMFNGLVTNSQAFVNGDIGILVSGGVLSGNTSFGNFGYGIACDASTAIGNTARFNFRNLEVYTGGCTAVNNTAP